jgi:hypothetical protein
MPSLPKGHYTIIYRLIYKKRRGESTVARPHLEALALPVCQTSNAETHAEYVYKRQEMHEKP